MTTQDPSERPSNRRSSERRQTDRALRECEERYRALFDSVDCVYLHDFEGRFLDANLATLELLGYEYHEMLTLNFSLLLDDDQRAKASGVLAELRQTGSQKTLAEFRLRRKTGEYADVETRSSVVLRSGQPYAVLVMGHDVTKRKEIEASLEKTRKELAATKRAEDAAREYAESIINTVREPVIALDQDLRVVTVSRSFQEFFQVDPEETRGQLIYDLCDRQWDIPKLRELLETILPRGTSFDGYRVEHEFAIIGRRTILLNARQIEQASGNERIILLAIEDITERTQAEAALRESEERYHTLVNLSPDATIVHIDRKWVFANPAAARLFGADSPAELVGQDSFMRAHPDYRELAVQRAAQVSAGAVTKPTEIKILRLDGTAVEVEVNSARIEFDGSPANQVVLRDITERKQAEASLRMAQFSVDNVPDCIVWIDHDGRYVEVNQTTCARLGYSRDELLTLSVFDLTVGLLPDTWPDRWRELKEVGPFTFEKRYRTKSGEIFPVEISSRILEYGGREYLLGIFRDITARKQADDSLRLMRYSVDQAAESVLWMAPSGRFLYVNELECRRLGYSRDELLSLSVFDVTVDLSVATWPQRWEEIKKAQGATFENLRRRKDGSVFPVEITSKIIEYDGKELLCSFVHDITQRRQAEEALRASEARYRLLADYATDVIWVLDAESQTFRYMSPSVERLLGFTDQEMVGRSVAQTVTPASLELIQGVTPFRIERMLQGHDEFYFDEVDVIHKDGHVVSTEINMHFVLNDATGCIEGTGVMRDATERKAAEAALRRSEEHLRQSQKMEAVGQLAGGIAHDFNNLLTAILGYSDLILSDGSSTVDEVRFDLEEIKRAGERASVLTQQILAFSRRQALRPQVVLLDEIIRGIEPLLRRTIGEDIDLQITESPGPVPVDLDRNQFEQVVMNLVINARDAMPSGGRLTIETGTVELDAEFCRTHAGALPGSYVMLRVSDTGVGMDEATQERIFEPFFTTKALGAGTGLGLATVYGIVKQSNGSIFVQSEPGRGSSFALYLPRAAESDILDEMPIPPQAPAGGPETIMVVEDEEALRGLIERILGAAGYQTLIFSSPEEALAALKQGEPVVDMLLTDVMLPGPMQGHDLARAILASRLHLPVLYISGYSRDVLVHAGRLDEGVNLLEKPFSPKALATMVRTVLDQARTPR